jgi:hypothetical protein
MSDLPSLDQPQAYVVVGPDDQRGPYTLDLLIGEVVAGRLHDATPVWWPGLADWTTMTGHPGLASEIQRRRSPAPAASAFTPPAAPPPPQQPQAPVPSAPAEPVAPPPGQQQAEGYDYGQSPGGYPAAASPGQDYSTDMYAGYGAPVQPAVEPSPPEEPMAAVSPVAEPVQPMGGPAEAQDATQLHGETVAADVTGGDVPEMHPAPEPSAGGMFSTGAPAAADAQWSTGNWADQASPTPTSDSSAFAPSAAPDPAAYPAQYAPPAEEVVSDTGVVMEVEPIQLTAQDFQAVDQPVGDTEEGYRAAGDAMGLDPAHGAAFADLIARSRARSEAAAVVAAIDDAFVESVATAATAQGLTEIGRDDDADGHHLSFRTVAGDTWKVDLGKVTGSEVAVREGDLTLQASCTSTTYGGGAVGSTGEHGEIVITTQEFGGASTARLSLLLALSDYVRDDRTVDRQSLERDLQAVIVAVRQRLS